MSVRGERVAAQKEESFVRAAHDDYEKGETLPAIAARLGVTVQWLHYRFGKLGLQCRPGGWALGVLTPKLRRSVVKRSNRGERVADIAIAEGVSVASVERVRRDAGVEGRKTGATLAPQRKARRYDEEGNLTHRWCPACARMRQVKFFWKNKASVDGLQYQCRDCRNEARKHKARKATNKPKHERRSQR